MAGRVAHYKTVDVEVLRKIVGDSYSYSEVLRRVGYRTIAGNYRGFKDYLLGLDIDINHFRQSGRHFQILNTTDRSYLLCENSTYSRSTVKKYIIKQKLIPYICKECKLPPIWNNKKIVLILDYINGVNNDNRLDNLRFLCPNCNSQTDTFAARNYNYDLKKTCENKIINNIESEPQISKEELIDLLTYHSSLSSIMFNINISYRKLMFIINRHNIDYKFYLKRLHLEKEIVVDFLNGQSIKELSIKYNSKNIRNLLLSNKQVREQELNSTVDCAEITIKHPIHSIINATQEPKNKLVSDRRLKGLL